MVQPSVSHAKFRAEIQLPPHPEEMVWGHLFIASTSPGAGGLSIPLWLSGAGSLPPCPSPGYGNWDRQRCLYSSYAGRAPARTRLLNHNGKSLWQITMLWKSKPVGGIKKKKLKEKTKCKERKQKEGNCTDFIQETEAVACKPQAARNLKGFLILP